MIVYSKTCLACSDKHRWREIKRFAIKNYLPLEERRVTSSRVWLEEANRYDVEMPFVLHNKVALHLSEPLEKLL